MMKLHPAATGLRASLPGLWFGAIVALGLGCPGPGTKADNPDDPTLPDKPKPQVKTPDVAGPAVPADFHPANIDPMDGNDEAARSPLLGIMAEENARWMKTLKTQVPAPAYYLAYQIHEQRVVRLQAEGGAMISDDDETNRYLDVEVRVGRPELDNHRPVSDNNGVNGTMVRQTRAPFGTDKLAIQSAFWVETDRRYREAALQLSYVMQDKMVSKNKKHEPDFVHEKKESFVQPLAHLTFDKKKWSQRVRACSKRAMRGVATRATCSVGFELNTMYLVNSEGTELQMSWPTARIAVTAGVKADDGAPLNRLEQRFARTPAGLPDDAAIDEMIKTATGDLDALHKAPVVDPYVGPAILEGRAAGVFFHEVFGHRIEGHRQKGDISGRTFSSKVGEKILPDWMTVYDDPTLDRINGVPLNGFYRFDDEGVRAQRAMLIDKGVLRGFVLGRDPIAGFPHSNGHGRKQLGRTTVSRQGNLVVEAAHSVTNKQLYAELIAEVKRQDKEFGMVFTDISGGFTNTSQFAPQSFKVHPVMAYRVYTDGRKELVRGVDIVGTPLSALGSIIAAGRSTETFNGTCGAESGWVPVSASAPSLLVKQIEVERAPQPRDRSPVLPPPSVRAGGAR